MLVYYLVTIVANIAAALIFYKNINVNALSILPLFLIALMFFQATDFKHEKTENGFRINYASNLTADEENDMMDSGSKFLLRTIPFMIPFVLFFPSYVKSLSILVYIIGVIGGLFIYRLKNKGKINDRMNSEEKERKEQERKEELGKWK